MKYIFLIFLFLGSRSVTAQVRDSFSDAELLSDPEWSFVAGNWVVNSNLELQSNNLVADEIFYISTPNSLVIAQWEITVRLEFATSGANYVDVFFMSSSENPSGVANGYFVRLGNTSDEISLYRKDGGTVSKIIDGIDGSLSGSNNSIRLKVTRSHLNNWTLFREINNAGFFYNEGQVVDNTYSDTQFFGIVVKQSSASFFSKHYFDDILIQPFVPDTIPPALLSLTVADSKRIDILFNEPLSAICCSSLNMYNVDNNLGFPASVTCDPVNPSLLKLEFNTDFPERTELILTASGITDLNNNQLPEMRIPFAYIIPKHHDVVIHEIMADPTPVNELPDAEWVEIRNVSGFDLNLAGWRINKPGHESGFFPPVVLKKDSMIVLTSTSNIPLFSNSQVIGLPSFPGLNNSGDTLYLVSGKGSTIHAVAYNDNWYKDDFKKRGGFTLELGNHLFPCAGDEVWYASNDPGGGTPGMANTISIEIPGNSSINLVHAFPTDSITLYLYFNETIDSTLASSATFLINDRNIITSVEVLSPLFNTVVLKLTEPLNTGNIYNLKCLDITDCMGNPAVDIIEVKVGLPEVIEEKDLIINEVMFNPKPGSSDFVEVYNRSDKILNAASVYLANCSSSGAISNPVPVSGTGKLIFPGDFIVATENSRLIMDYYNVLMRENLWEVNLPSYNDDKGCVVLVDKSGQVIDQVSYSDDWHFSLIKNAEGVSLERTSYEGNSDDPANWHSASESTGYATPARKNSQLRHSEPSAVQFSVEPITISPDHDGRDDFAIIQYRMEQPGYVANVTIFDAAGRVVRYLNRNSLCGLEGKWKWDGLGENNKILPAGIYIVYAQFFNLNGKTEHFKKAMVVAR